MSRFIQRLLEDRAAETALECGLVLALASVVIITTALLLR
jgi:Flp pilus assembly pilin Flp